MQIYFSSKGRFVSFGCPPKLTNLPPCYVFLIQIMNGNCIFSSLLANIPPRPKTDKRTPLKSGGLMSLPVLQSSVGPDSDADIGNAVDDRTGGRSDARTSGRALWCGRLACRELWLRVRSHLHAPYTRHPRGAF